MSEAGTASPAPTRRVTNLPFLVGILGLLACALSPIVIGLLPGALGVRTAIDARRIGFRGWVLYSGLSLSAIGLAASVLSAILWGGSLATILLSRDVEREAVVWRGREIANFSLQVDDHEVFEYAQFRREHPDHRLALHFWSSEFAPCQASVANAAEAARGVDSLTLIGIAPEDSPESARAFLGTDAIGMRTAFGAQRLPSPLDTAGARPTTVIIHPCGKIELVLLGVRNREELRRAYLGEGLAP